LTRVKAFSEPLLANPGVLQIQAFVLAEAFYEDGVRSGPVSVN
jgi:hypothetical protein